MGSILGGGGGGGLGGLLDPLGILGGGKEGGGGFLGGLLGNLPDPLGVGKMLGIGGKEEAAPGAVPGGPTGPAPGVNYAPQGSQSGVSFGMDAPSPMGPVGFGIGGGPPKR